MEEPRLVDEGIRALRLKRSAEGHDGIREGIDGVRVVEGLGAERTEEDSAAGQRRTVVDIGVRLDDPDEFLTRVVEVQLDLVAG